MAFWGCWSVSPTCQTVEIGVTLEKLVLLRPVGAAGGYNCLKMGRFGLSV